MNDAERTELIRLRFKCRKPSSGVPIRTTVQRGAKWWEYYGTGEIAKASVKLGLSDSEDRKQWVSKADPKPSTITPKTKRTAKASPLNLIASKWRTFSP